MYPIGAQPTGSRHANTQAPDSAQFYFNNMMAPFGQQPIATQPAMNPQAQPPSFEQQTLNMMPAAFAMGMNPMLMQFLEDATRYNAPVGTYDDDQTLLVDVLHTSAKNGLTHKHALESLHGRNNHSSSLWKDYYLEHAQRIDKLVAAKSNAGSSKPNGITRPSFSWEKAARNSSNAKARGPKHKTQTAVRSVVSPPAKKRPRFSNATESVSRPNEVSAQSRSPTPPTDIVMHANGKAFYTPDERNYFFDLVQRRLSKDSSISRMDLCRELEEKLPHHTAASWSSHWRRCEDKGWDPLTGNNGKDAETPKVDSGSVCRPKDRRKSHGDAVVKAEPIDDDALDLGGPVSEDEGKSKKKKRVLVRFTDQDMEDIVKHVGSFTVVEWARLSPPERWTTFSKTHPSQRSAMAWQTAYRRREVVIDSKAAKFRKMQTSS
ncbi:hypothetical protein HGRIS_008092 [Hohenbuehelia grisea]|uniref:Clr5 domain-containing protein n=1 Tax=Hohenbuehelia grisea TaxID=104357 RepID=A0ABR3J7A3_9AGAR